MKATRAGREQPIRLQVPINLKTARVPGLTIPPALRLRADQVVEP